MKFINNGDKHSEYDYFDDCPPHEETSKPRYTPSYYNISKKHSGKSKSCKSNMN